VSARAGERTKCNMFYILLSLKSHSKRFL